MDNMDEIGKLSQTFDFCKQKKLLCFLVELSDKNYLL